MRVLITGGLGLTGGRPVQYLRQAGHQVVFGTPKASSPSGNVAAEIDAALFPRRELFGDAR